MYNNMSFAPGALPSRNTAVVGSAQTVRPSATALFSVNSADRFRNYAEERDGTTTPYDFVIRKQENLLSGFFSRIAVSEIQFNMTLPNVQGSTTQIVVDTIVGGVPTETIIDFSAEEGFYTPAEFATAFQNVIRLIPGMAGFTMVYGLDNQPIFVYDTNSLNTISFSPVDESGTFPYGNDRIQLFDMLGFKTGVNDLVSITNSGEPTFFQKYRFFDFVSTILTGNQALKDATSAPIDRNVLCRLYVEDGTNQHVSVNDPDFSPNGTQPFTIYRQFSTPKQIAWDGRQPIGQVNFQVYDQDGYLLSGGEYVGGDFQMTLLVSEN